MFRRVRELLATGIVDPSIAVPLAELEQVITRLNARGITQETLTRRVRASTIIRNAQARLLLRDALRPAAFAARTIDPALGDDPKALRRAMRMPRNRTDIVALVVAAHAFANAVDQHADTFISAGLPPDFAARIRAHASTLESTVDARSTDLQHRIAATRGIEVESLRGRALVRLLDSLVEPVLRDDPARIAEWHKAIDVPKVASGNGKSSDAQLSGAQPSDAQLSGAQLPEAQLSIVHPTTAADLSVAASEPPQRSAA
ncbi:MAG: hypothetical protein ABI910_23605 [Gemmatimonadota bacterium]